MAELDPNPLAALSPPHWVISESDHGGYVIIASWTMMCYMVITVIVRLARMATIRSWSMDDNVIAGASAFGLVQCGLLHKAVLAGLGRRQADLLDFQLDAYNKYMYAYQIFFIFTICFSKMSLLLFIIRLTPNHATIKAGRILMGVVTVWGIATVFALAFQCSLPQPWNVTSGTCNNQGALYFVTAILDVITDLAITMLPIIMMWNIQIQRSKKVTVMAVFLCRLVVCFAEIPRMIYLARYLQSSDKTWGNVNLSIWTQAVTHLSIITACIPCLQHFLASMRSGVFNTALPAGFEEGITLSSMDGNRTLVRDLYGKRKINTTHTVIESAGVPQRSESKTRLVDDDRIYKTTEFVIDTNEDGGNGHDNGNGNGHGDGKQQGEPSSN